MAGEVAVDEKGIIEKEAGVTKGDGERSKVSAVILLLSRFFFCCSKKKKKEASIFHSEIRSIVSWKNNQ